MRWNFVFILHWRKYRNNPRYEESTIPTFDASTLFYSMFSVYGVYGIYVWISRGLTLKTEESCWIGRKGSIASRNVEDEHETTCTRRRALVPESSGSHCAGEQLPPFVSSFFLSFLATLAPLLSPTDDHGPYIDPRSQWRHLVSCPTFTNLADRRPNQDCIPEALRWPLFSRFVLLSRDGSMIRQFLFERFLS